MSRKRLWLRRGLCLLAVLGGAVLIGCRGGVAAWLLFWACLLPPLLALVWYLAGLRRLRALARTAELCLSRAAERLADRGVALEWDDGVPAALAAGSRGSGRAARRAAETALGRLLAGPLAAGALDGGGRVRLRLDGAEILAETGGPRKKPL